jgi:hypothetical protein
VEDHRPLLALELRGGAVEDHRPYWLWKSVGGRWRTTAPTLEEALSYQMSAWSPLLRECSLDQGSIVRFPGNLVTVRTARFVRFCPADHYLRTVVGRRRSVDKTLR